MKTVLTDDNSSDWSIEIFDGICVNASTKRGKQKQPTTTSDSDSNTDLKPALEDVHPFFSRDFSAQVTVSATQSLTRQETAEMILNANPKSRMFALAHRREGQQTLAINSSKSTSLVKPHPAVLAHELKGNAPQNDHLPDQVEFQKKHQPHQPRSLEKFSSSTLSTPSGSGSKVSGGESSLPTYSFLEYDNPPAVIYTQSESEANTLVQTLQGPLGFDLEWRVLWHPGAKERRTALVQLCDYETILLIQISSMKGFPKKVLEVIESGNIAKFGANILNDGEKLYRDFGIRARGLVELGALATKADVQFSSVYNREIVSLAKMVSMYLSRSLLKGKVRTSNWEAKLSREMIEYAANDCHCALMVYDRLYSIAAKSGNALDALACARHVEPRSLRFKDGSFQTSGHGPSRTMGSGTPNYCIPEPPRPQQLRAYKLWHVNKMPLEQICMALRMGDRVEPLKTTTVISYVVGALQGDPRLPFNMDQLKALVLMEASSWQRHREWIASRE